MSGATRRVALVIRREWNQRVRTRAFLISTAISVALVVAIILVPDIYGGADRIRTVGLVGERSEQLPGRIRGSGGELGLSVRTKTLSDEMAGRAALRSDEVTVLLVDQRELVWKAEPDDALGAAVTAAVQVVERQAMVERLGLSPEESQRLLRPPDLVSRSLDRATEERAEREELATVGVGVLLMAIAFYAGFLLVGVVEEKTSRVVEVLLSRLRPTELFTGKIVGIGLVGLAQLALVAAAALIAMSFSRDPAPETAPGTIGWIVFWFILGYGFYSILYGTVGSLISRQEEAESVQFPVTAVLLIAYFFSMEAARSPDGVAALIGSFVPFTAPMVLIVRIAHGGVPAWQILLSVGAMVVSVLVLVRLAGRIYSGAVLRIGRRLRLREAWRGAEA